MRLRRVTAEAFGPFTDAVLDLAAGMTVVCGPNESGKSTWHAAVYAALCGLRRGRGKPRKAEQAFADRHRPWDGQAWRVSATAELADGRVLEFRQDLAGKVDCRVRDVELGRDLSDELLHDGSPDGAVLFGLTRDTLLPTVCVRQADVLGVLGEPDALQETLQRAAATGGADDTAQRALERLDAFHRDRVGTDRRNSTKPLRRAMDAAQEASRRLEDARAAHDEYLALARQRDDARRAADEALADRDRARASLARRELDRAERRLAEVASLAASVPDGSPPDPDADAELAEQVRSALAQWESRPPEPEPASGPSAADLERRLAALPEPPSGDVEVHVDVAAARTAWERAAARLEDHGQPAPAPGDTAPVAECPDGVAAGQLRGLADELETPLPEVDDELARRAADSGGDGSRRTPLLVAAAVAVVTGVVLLAAGSAAVGGVLLAVGTGLGGAGWMARAGADAGAQQAQAQVAVQHAPAEHARRRRSDAAERARGWGLPEDPDALRDLARTVDDRAHRAEQQAAQQAEVARRRQARDEAADALRQALADRGVPADGDLEAAVAGYEAGCRRRAERAREAGRAEDLRAQIADRRHWEAAVERDRRRRYDADEAVRAAARQVGVDADPPASDLGELVDHLEAWQRRRAERRAALSTQWEQWNRLQALLGDATVDEVHAEVARKRDAAAEYAELEGLALPEVDADAVVAGYEEHAGEARQRLARLEGQLNDRAATTPSVAEAEEAHARAEAELARLRRLDETVRTTDEFLAHARDRVHRDIAPRLKRSVERWLPRVTGERYDEATVDPATLRVRVRGAGGPWRDAALLSQGTAEQVYLLLRVAMAEHLVTTDEPAPLLLDDPTVQTDRHRTRALLELLHALSRERQVVVFTQEDEVATWAREQLTGPDDAVVELDPAPVPA